MTTFDEREASMEKKFAHDEETLFKAQARRNRLLGEWLAEKFGMSGEKAQEYARSVVAADLEEPGEEDVFRKIRSDCDARNFAVTDPELRKAMSDFMAVAIEQVRKN